MGLMAWGDTVLRRVMLLQGGASRRFETTRGGVHYLDLPGHGALPTTVVLHGLGTTAAPGWRFYRALAPSVRRVVAPDLPGHGASDDIPDARGLDAMFAAMADALDQVAGDSLILVGNSLGGGVALRYALERPERVAALVLQSPAGAWMTAEELAAFTASFDMSSAWQAMGFLWRAFHDMPVYAPLIAGEVSAAFNRPAVRALITGVRQDHLFAPEQLAGLRVPALLQWGESERIMAPASLAYFRTHLPSHVVVERPRKLGHAPYLEQPVASALRIVAFLHGVLGEPERPLLAAPLTTPRALPA